MAVIHAKQLADGRWECQGCLCKFTKHKRDKEHPDGWTTPPKFHNDACKKSFHHGGLSMKKIMGIMRQVAREEIQFAMGQRYTLTGAEINSKRKSVIKAEEARA